MTHSFNSRPHALRAPLLLKHNTRSTCCDESETGTTNNEAQLMPFTSSVADQVMQPSDAYLLASVSVLGLLIMACVAAFGIYRFCAFLCGAMTFAVENGDDPVCTPLCWKGPQPYSQVDDAESGGV